MTPENIIQTLSERSPGTVAIDAWGKTSLFYNPEGLLPRGFYFATVKQKDGENDRASDLIRGGVFRFNTGTAKPLFLERFGPPPARPAKGKAVASPWDFTELDVISPHPVYGWMSWISVLNPSPETLLELKPMIEAAFLKARAAFEKKTK
ncbi:hypothetical protein HUO14_02655 [Parasphingorhabdus flavimaris]|uniref:DUF6194 domain-containing protein n=1 Tax=Parasphingorhabdus flavimaris TaxID=266812 RepID=A0ABX2MZC1_9SPHN|nr:hypothetical protein [Parasphingorhabdus flavimaris]